MKKEKYIAPKIEVIKTITESMLQTTTAQVRSGTGSDDSDAKNMRNWIDRNIGEDDGTNEIDPD